MALDSLSYNKQSTQNNPWEGTVSPKGIDNAEPEDRSRINCHIESRMLNTVLRCAKKRETTTLVSLQDVAMRPNI
jgi:hypothetical protein